MAGWFNSGSKKQLTFVGNIKLGDTYRRFLVLSLVVSEFDKNGGKNAVAVNTILANIPTGLPIETSTACVQDLIILAKKEYLQFEISSDSINKTYRPTSKGLKYYLSNVKTINEALLALEEMY